MISGTAPLQGLPSAHQGLTLARVQTPNGSILAACSVMPWLGARTCWPGDPSAALAVWFPHTLTDHLRQINEARRTAEPVVWGGDFNQGLTGPEQVGSGPLPGTRPRKSGMADNNRWCRAHAWSGQRRQRELFGAVRARAGPLAGHMLDMQPSPSRQ